MSNTEQSAFRIGEFRAPLTSSTTNALLQDADPALHHMLAFYKAVLRIHLGARFTAEATAAALALPTGAAPAVVGVAIPYDPVPYLGQVQYTFPILALFAVEEQPREKTRIWHHTVAEWRMLYALPPLDPAQLLKLSPILRAAGKVLVNRTELGYDPAYLAGAVVAATAGLEEIAVESIKYGSIPGRETKLVFPAVELTLRAIERRQPTDAAGVIQPLEGIDAGISVKDKAGEETLVEVKEDLTP